MVKYFLFLLVALNISCVKNNEPVPTTFINSNSEKKVENLEKQKPIIKLENSLHLQGRFKINYPSPKQENKIESLPELDLQGQVIIKKPIPETLLGNYQFDKNNSESGENTEKLTLASPLGETLLVIHKTNDLLVLTTAKNDIISYQLPDELRIFYQQIGFQFPINQLSEWLFLKTESFQGNWHITPKSEENGIFHKWIIEEPTLGIELVLLVE